MEGLINNHQSENEKIQLPPFAFRPLLDPIVDVRPSLLYALSVIVLNESERRMVKLNQSSAIFFAQPILQIRDHRIRHEKGSGNFQQRWPLDGLHVSPEVSVA